jgi:hypothetical protein
MLANDWRVPTADHCLAVEKADARPRSNKSCLLTSVQNGRAEDDHISELAFYHVSLVQ